VQVEGWLKGEFLFFLDGKKANGKIINFEREIQMGSGKKKIDFYIHLDKSQKLEAWIELKHWLVGYQKGTKYNAQFYFSDPSSVGIRSDAEKLNKVSKDRSYLLILATANPGINDWDAGVRKFNEKFSPLRLVSLIEPDSFPEFYFLGLLRIES
jgi:hypothetical protein